MKTSRLGALLAGPAKAKGKEKAKEVAMRRLFLLSFLFLLAAVSACQGAPTPSPTPERSPTATPTLAAAYTPPVNPVINQFRVQDAAEGVLTVIWWTDRPTTGRLEYGLTDQYGLSTPWTEGLTTSNGATVSGLPGVEVMYHFRIRVKDAAGNETVLEDEVVNIYVYTMPRAAQSQAKFENNHFYPPRLTIDRGTLVTWTNRDSVAHRVKGPEELWDASLLIGTDFTESPVLSQGQSYGYIFADAGTYTIVCGLHPSETMVIIVK